MKRLIKKIFLLGFLLLVLLYLMVVVLKLFDQSPVFTTSISFDAKMIFLQKKGIINTDLMAIGSSITLDNVNSDIIVSSIRGQSYLNFAAWAVKMTDLNYLLKYYIPKYKPKCILIASALFDFESNLDSIVYPKYYEFSMFLSNQFDAYFYFKNRQIDAIIERNYNLHLYRTLLDNYDNLSFDEYGGVQLNVPKENIDPYRWNKKLKKLNEEQFEALQNFIEYISAEKVKLVFIQSPVKKGYYDILSDKNELYNVFSRIKNIVTSKNNIYLNLYDENKYIDSSFCDANHMNSGASKYFTQEIIEKINLDSLLNTDY